MGSFELNQKYTIDKYCSRMEVAKAIGTNLIDPLWNSILEYRKTYVRPLSIHDAVKASFNLTCIETVQDKSYKISEKISSYIIGVGKLADSKIAKRTYTSDMLKTSLKSIARLEKIDASEITLQNIIEGKCENETYATLVRYFNALNFISTNPTTYFGEDRLAQLYSILTGQEELVSFFRVNDNVTLASKVLVDREYDNGVPVHLLDDMMENLYEFMNNKDISIVTRTVGILFMFNYIKPFEQFNIEIACLIIKDLFIDSQLDSSAIYLPIELLAIDQQLFGEINKEVQKSHDFTYAYIRGANLLIDAFDLALDKIVQVNAHALDMTAKLGDNREKIKAEFGIDVEKEEEKKPAFIEPKVKLQPKVENKNSSQPIVENVSEKGLTERDYKKLEEELLECNPFIKKGQAHFYVRHCTKGKFYTIQQYKKAEGCVYETARTSMDNLALQGLYRKESIKNKFVYTPIDKE